MLGKAKIKYIQSLGQKKHRDEEGLFIAEGPKIINDLLYSRPQNVQDVYGVKEWIKEINPDLLSWLPKQAGIRIYGPTLEGKDVSKMSPLKEGIILIGNESKGIQEGLLAMANEKITIPHSVRQNTSPESHRIGQGEAESLNAAVATGIVLSHII